MCIFFLLLSFFSFAFLILFLAKTAVGVVSRLLALVGPVNLVTGVLIKFDQVPDYLSASGWVLHPSWGFLVAEDMPARGAPWCSSMFHTVFVCGTYVCEFTGTDPDCWCSVFFCRDGVVLYRLIVFVGTAAGRTVCANFDRHMVALVPWYRLPRCALYVVQQCCVQSVIPW